MNEEVAQLIRLEIRRLRREGRHQEALDKLVPLYDDILKRASSEFGDESHFVLSDLIALSGEYAPAADKLRELQAAISRLISGGIPDRSVFSGLENINRALKDVQATIDLFRKIEASSPKSAKDLSDIVIDSLVDLKEYSWARKYMSSPSVEYSKLKRNFEECGLYLEEEKFPDRSPEAFALAVEVFVEIFVDGVRRLIAVLTHTNEIDAAVEIERDAILLVGYKAFTQDASLDEAEG